MRASGLAVFMLGVCGVIPAQTIRFTPVEKTTVLAREADAPTTNEQRHARIKELFTQAGCRGPTLTEETVEGSGIPNIICRLRGKSDETIVVGAPYGQGASHGASDSWSGAALLPSIYQSLAKRPRHHTLVFIAFAGSGNSSAGEEFYAAHMTEKEAGQTEAVVNLMTLGLSPTKVWTHHSDKDLLHSLVVSAYLLNVLVSQVDMDDSITPQPASFAASQIPQITVHSMTQQDLTTSTTPAFRPKDYLDTYRLISGYIAYLDQTLKRRKIK
jgi:hypothetical protein